MFRSKRVLKTAWPNLGLFLTDSNTLGKSALSLWIWQTQQWAGGMVASPEGSTTARTWEALDPNLTTLRCLVPSCFRYSVLHWGHYVLKALGQEDLVGRKDHISCSQSQERISLGDKIGNSELISNTYSTIPSSLPRQHFT